jgi:hypothetical protein
MNDSNSDIEFFHGKYPKLISNQSRTGKYTYLGPLKGLGCRGNRAAIQIESRRQAGLLRILLQEMSYHQVGCLECGGGGTSETPRIPFRSSSRRAFLFRI